MIKMMKTVSAESWGGYNVKKNKTSSDFFIKLNYTWKLKRVSWKKVLYIVQG